MELSESKIVPIAINELDKCSSCGACHSVCPVYQLSGRESLSARGRINLLKAMADGDFKSSRIGQGIFNRCLLCYACMTVCPSGVNTENIWTEAREYFARTVGAGIKGTAIRAVSVDNNLRRCASLARLLQNLPGTTSKSGKFRPRFAKKFLLDFLPYVVPAKGERRFRVGYFVGCVSNFFLREIGIAAIEVLSAVGCEVVIPHRQVCCGAPAFNNGEMKAAAALAKRNIQVFNEAEVDCILSADASCGGSFNHEYRRLVGDYPGYREFADKYRELHGFILEAGLPADLRNIASRVAYHDSCHLAHTQGIRTPPRELLKSLPGVELVEMANSDICCGFGGSFSLLHSTDSSEVSAAKLRYAIDAGVKETAAGSPGCVLKLKEEAAVSGIDMEIRHTVEYIYERLREQPFTSSLKE